MTKIYKKYFCSLKMSQQNFIFRAKTKDAFVIKVIGELLNNIIKYAPFRITDKGIFLTQVDPRREQLVDLSLLKENFIIYRYQKPISFSVNSGHFYKMLKHIKKKDNITLFITEEEPYKLGICVEQSDENNRITTYIRITYNQPEDIVTPEGYENPIIMTSKEFQKMKNLHNISRTISLTSHGGYIKFFCDGSELYQREIVIGDQDDQENHLVEKPYVQNFTTSYITGLTKCAGCAGQSGNVQVFVPISDENLPLKIKMKAGNLGDLVVFIKSREMLELEQDENQQEEPQEEHVSGDSGATDEQDD
jgi:proliferating cell nuclear antigen PCNA